MQCLVFKLAHDHLLPVSQKHMALITLFNGRISLLSGTPCFIGSLLGVKYLYKTRLITNIATRKRGTMNVQNRSFIIVIGGSESLEGDVVDQIRYEILNDNKL